LLLAIVYLFRFNHLVSCLDRWRAVSPNPLSFTTCDVCKFQYQIQIQEEKRSCATVKFSLLVFRDIFAIIFVLNFIIVALGFLAVWIDPQTFVEQYMPVEDSWSSNTKTVIRIYETGGLLFLFFMGIIGCITFCVMKCSGTPNSKPAPVTYTRNPYQSYYCGDFYFIYCMWPNTYGNSYGSCCPGGGSDCNGNYNHSSCNNCDCKGDSGGNVLAFLLIVVIVVVVVLIVLGLVFAIGLSTFAISRIIQRHIHVLNKHKQASVMVVQDLSEQNSINNLDMDDEIFAAPTAPLLMNV